MAAAHDHETTTAAARESHEFLDLGDGLRADEELWSREEGLRPGVVKMVRRGAEGHRGVELGELALDDRVHFDCFWDINSDDVCMRDKYAQSMWSG